MNRPAPSKPLFGLFWRLYIILGMVSASFGVYLIRLPQITPGSSAGLDPVRIVGIILLAFGIVRVVNALAQISQMRRRNPSLFRLPRLLVNAMARISRIRRP